jgi:hypothetical protein
MTRANGVVTSFRPLQTAWNIPRTSRYKLATNNASNDPKTFSRIDSDNQSVVHSFGRPQLIETLYLLQMHELPALEHRSEARKTIFYHLIFHSQTWFFSCYLELMVTCLRKLIRYGGWDRGLIPGIGILYFFNTISALALLKSHIQGYRYKSFYRELKWEEHEAERLIPFLSRTRISGGFHALTFIAFILWCLVKWLNFIFHNCFGMWMKTFMKYDAYLMAQKTRPN